MIAKSSAIKELEVYHDYIQSAGAGENKPEKMAELAECAHTDEFDSAVCDNEREPPAGLFLFWIGLGVDSLGLILSKFVGQMLP